MKFSSALIVLWVALFPLSAAAAESISTNKRVPISADPSVAGEAKDLDRKLWISQFTHGMRRNPDAFRDAVFRRYYGKQGDDLQILASINDSIIRYGKQFPVVGSGFSLLEEFAKDSRQWSGGIEQKKSAAAGAINRCPQCMDAFANETYDLLVAQTKGKALTPNEKVMFEGLNEQIGKGIFHNIDASWKDLAAGANPNDVTLWQGEALLGVFGDLSAMNRTQYRSLLQDSQKFRSFVDARLSALDESIADGFSDIRSVFSKISQENEAAAIRHQKFADLSSDINDFHAGAGLAVSLLNAAGRGADAERLSVVSSATFSAYEAIVRRGIDQTQMSQFAATAVTFNSVLIVANIMQAQNKKTETQYVLDALAGISDQITRLAADVGHLRQQVHAVSSAIDVLRRNADAQYSSLYNVTKNLERDFADDRLQRWIAERSKITSKIKKIEIHCKTITNQVTGIVFDNASTTLQDDFRDNCLSPLLEVMTIDAVAAHIVQPSQSPVSGDGEIQMFNAALQGKVSPELWYPRLGQRLPLSRNPSSTSAASVNVAAQLSLEVPGSGESVLAQPIDLELWRDAMNAYATAIISWPSYIPSESRPKDKIILELETQTINKAEQVRGWLNQRLSTDRFNAAVESYRESALATLRALRVQAERFLQEKQRAEWCSNPSKTTLSGNVGPAEAQWLLVACDFDSGSPLQLSELRGDMLIARNFMVKAPIFPIELLLFHDEFKAAAARLATEMGAPRLEVSLGRKFSRDELSLIAGLRMIDNADFVLYRLTPDAPQVKRPAIVSIATPMTPSLDQNWSCLREAVRLVPVGDLEGAMKLCATKARQGCTSITDTSSIASFSYKLCDGPINFKDEYYSALRYSTGDRYVELLSKRIADESEARNSSAIRESFILRRYGLSPDIMSTNDSIVNHSLRIKGIDLQGLPSKAGILSKASGVDGMKFEVVEEYAADQASQTLSRIEARLAGLQSGLYKYFHREDSAASLRPYYDQLNRSYASLMLHAYLYLQLDASDTPSLKDFLQLPISGQALAEAFASERMPPKLGQRLLLASEFWSKGFPTLDAFEFAADRMTSRDCGPPGQDVKLWYPPKRGYLLNLVAKAEEWSELSEDMYCKMWKDQAAKLVSANAHTPLFDGGTFAFNRGSLFLNDGLDAWARVSNERMLRKRLIRTQ